MTNYSGRMTNPITAIKIAERISKERKSAGLSIAALVELTGIADKTLRRRIAAPEYFTLAELSAIASVFGILLEDLLTEPRAISTVAC